MLRWLLVCALVAQTLAASRHDRHASWPKWMKMPRMEWPDWMPTQEDIPQIDLTQIDLPEMPKLPSVNIPDIQIPEITMPDVQLPEINLPEIFTDRGSSRSAQSQRANQRQPAVNFQPSRKGRRGQSGHERPQLDSARRPSQSRQDQPDARVPRPSSDVRRPSDPRRLPSDQGYVIGFPGPDGDRQRGRQEQQSGPLSSGKLRRGQLAIDAEPMSARQWPHQVGRQEQQSGPVTSGGKLRKGQLAIDAEPSQQWPHQRENKGRKSTPQRREGPPQRREPVRPNPQPKQRASYQRLSTRQRAEPSVGQQVEEFRSGMPRWLQTELNDTFSTMNREIEEGRLRMSSWADDISDAAQDWWNKWSARGDRRTPSRDQSPSGVPYREQSRGSSGNQNGGVRGPHHSNGRENGRHNGWGNERTNERGNGRPNGWGNDRTNEQGNGRQTGWGNGRQTGWGNERTHEQENGRQTGWGNGRQTGWETGRQSGWGNERTNGWGNVDSNRQGADWWNGQGRGQSDRRPGHGRGHSISNGRGPTKGRKWWEGSGKRENSTWCTRPFRPTSNGPSREEPFYEVLCGGNDYEARLYNSSVWVSVTVKSLTYDLAVHKAYMKLYRYINGHNSHGAEVMRTAPIHTKVKSNSRNNRWFECHNYTISFFLPEDVHLDPPSPNDPELFIEHEGPTVYYAHAFRGYALEFNIWEYLDELTNTLDLSQEAYQMEDYVVNVYDAPWRFFNRRNDILVAMDTEILETPRCAVPEPQLPTTMFPEVPTTAPVEASTAKKTMVPSTARPATEAVTTAKKTPVPSTARPIPPTVLGEVPVEVKLPGGMKNPFENNNLEQEEGPDCVPGSECPRYETAVKYDGFEQRHYAYSRWICIDQAACDFERAQWLTQGPLLEYFYPKGNREQTAMIPTTPLVIGMDVSDLNRTDCGVMYTSCLFIPTEHQGAPPTPRDARLYIQDIPAMSRYVLPFGGFATSQNVPKLTIEFVMQLEESRLPYDGSIIAVAQYSTSKLDTTRINEVWIMDQSLIQGQIGLE